MSTNILSLPPGCLHSPPPLLPPSLCSLSCAPPLPVSSCALFSHSVSTHWHQEQSLSNTWDLGAALQLTLPLKTSALCFCSSCRESSVLWPAVEGTECHVSSAGKHSCRPACRSHRRRHHSRRVPVSLSVSLSLHQPRAH